MKKSRLVITMIICFITVIYGVFMVNVAYTQFNKKTIDKSIFASVDESSEGPKLSYSGLYGEIKISKSDERKLAIYFNPKPFDIRFGMGNKVLFINSGVFANMKNKFNDFIN